MEPIVSPPNPFVADDGRLALPSIPDVFSCPATGSSIY
jgi:hypothetical protein